MTVDDYYDMLLGIPEVERIKLGLSNEYLGKCRETEKTMAAEKGGEGKV